MQSLSFQDTDFKLHRYVSDSPGTGRGEVDDATVPSERSGINGQPLITHNDVNSTCVRTVFKIHS